MNRSPRITILIMLCLLSCIAPLPDANATIQTLRAGSVNDIIADMIIADRSRQATIIRVAPGHYTFTRRFDSKYGASLLPPVSTPIEIVGRDPATTIFTVDDEFAIPDRFFTVLRGGTLTLDDITLTRGLHLCQVFDCGTNGGGAAINGGGELQFHDCVLSSNGAADINGGSSSYGGAILNLSGHFLLDRTTVVGNGVVGFGGAIAVLGGTGSISSSVINANSAGFTGGSERNGGTVFGAGIFVARGAKLSIVASTISANSEGQEDDQEGVSLGVGIYNSGTVSLDNSAVTANASLTGLSAGPGAGGGIYNDGAMTITNSTVGGNYAGTLGGGIFNAGQLQMLGTTIAGNSVGGSNGVPAENLGFPADCTIDTPERCVSGGAGVWNEPAGTIKFATSVIAGNVATDCQGALISKGHNALGTASGCTLVPSPFLGGKPTHDQVNLNPRLGALDDNGVPGNAHYPVLVNSPLIDAGGGIGATCTRLDQIGVARVDGDHDHDSSDICDIGAIEYQPPRSH